MNYWYEFLKQSYIKSISSYFNSLISELYFFYIHEVKNMGISNLVNKNQQFTSQRRMITLFHSSSICKFLNIFTLHEISCKYKYDLHSS